VRGSLLSTLVENVVVVGLLHARPSDAEIQQRRPPCLIGCKRAFQGGLDVRGIVDALAVAAAASRNDVEVRLELEVGVEDAIAEVVLLNIAD
jgi:hypothetical protein